MKKVAKVSVKPTKEEQLIQKKEAISILLKDINKTDAIENPIIKPLSNIYLLHSRDLKYNDGKDQEITILSSNHNDIYKNSKVVLEIQSLFDAKLKTKKELVDTGRFRTSVFDVFMTHYQVSLVGNEFKFPSLTMRSIVEDVNDILFIKVVNKNTYVFNVTGQCFKCQISLTRFMDVLGKNKSFLRIHKNYIVNVKRYKSMTYDFHMRIPFSNVPLEKLMEVFIVTEEEINEKKRIESEWKVKIDEYKRDTKDSELQKAKKINQMIKDQNLKILKNYIIYDEDFDGLYYSIKVKEDLQSQFK